VNFKRTKINAGRLIALIRRLADKGGKSGQQRAPYFLTGRSRSGHTGREQIVQQKIYRLCRSFGGGSVSQACLRQSFGRQGWNGEV